MKHLFLPFLFLFLISGLNAQVPWKFSFQGVAKNANGQPLSAGTIVKVHFTIHENGANGQVVYVETHTPAVSHGGIFNVFIGTGQDKVGAELDEITWGSYPYYLQVEMAVDGVNYIDMGTTQLVSVPYAGYAAKAYSWRYNDPVVQTGTFGSGGIISNVGAGARLIWYPKKAAFRAGENFNSAWEDASIGDYSFAGNRGTASGARSTAFGQSVASGISSFSMGALSEASGNYSTAGGNASKAFGDYSFAMGNTTEAIGNSAIAFGRQTVAKAFGAMTVGTYNNVQDNATGTVQGAAGSDRIFQVGNGGGPQSLSNALTVLRNGNVGIGNNVLNPQNILEVGGRARIRHSASTAGIYFDDSQSKPEGFVGMMNDYTVGFYIGGKWMLQAYASSSGVYVAGDLGVAGELHEYSDRRLKRDISRVNNSFTKLTSLQGYNYYWKDSTKAQTLQTGLIAQEVEELFPELVKTDEKGMKSVNYIGLVPHLIEAIKELRKENSEVLSKMEAKINILMNAAGNKENAQAK